MKHAVILIKLCIICFFSSNGQVTSITAEPFYVGGASPSEFGYPPNHTTYRIYANTTNPTDRVTAVFGTPATPLSLSVSGSGIWNFLPGGVTGDAVPCIVYSSQPLAQYDSYVTVGVSCNNDGAANLVYRAEDNSQPWQTQAFSTSPYGLSDFFVNTPVGGTWFILPENPNSIAGSDLKVLIAQITTDGDICGTFNIQSYVNYSGAGSLPENSTFSFSSNPGCIPGCVDSYALNYNPSATYESGNCLFPCELTITNAQILDQCVAADEAEITITVSGNQSLLNYLVNGVEYGLTQSNTIEFNELSSGTYNIQIRDTRFDLLNVNPNNLVCEIEQTFSLSILNVQGCTDSNACNFNSSANCDDSSCIFPGCTNASACNYNSQAGCDDESCTFPGCTSINACNYNPQAGCNDGSCVFPGCTNASACNYNSLAGCDNGSCTFPGCLDPSACNFIPNAGCEDNSCLYPGCTAITACNYDVFAGCDNGSCVYPGCTDPIACNYSSNAFCSDGSCIFPGCTDLLACNYSASAGCDNGTCLYTAAPCNDLNPNTINDQINSNCNCAGQLLGCTNVSACNYNPSAVIENNSCVFPGCMDNSACNFNAAAGCDNGTCTFPGCTDSAAMNFDANAGCENGSCLYAGCTNSNACNFDPTANFNDGSCTYPGCTSSAACNYQPSAGCDNGSCLFTGTTCSDNNPGTMLDQVNANCICQGTPFNYGTIASTTTNLCPGVAPQTINLSAPLNLQSYAVQWYYRDGAIACPSGNSTAGWNILSGENGLSYAPTEFVGTRTYACFISPSGIYGIPAAWANGCRTISYYSFDAQAIIGNPNITPFSTVTYAVNPIAGHTFNWAVTNGAITSGQGTSVITILWGQNGPYQVTLTESNGICSDVSSLLVVNSNCSISVSAIAEGGNSFCPGSSNTLQAVSDATGITYQWFYNGSEIPGATDASVEITSGGNYQVLITQAACTAVSQTLFITTLPAVVVPQLTITSDTPGCSGGTVIISAEGGTFDSYLWNNGETTSTIEVSTSGDYSVDLADANGCHATAGPVSVNLALQEPLPICIVTVDPATNNNIIVWEPLSSDVTSAYAIYKETNIADEYASIGSVDYGSEGLFTDLNSNASVQASRYKLALIDTCGIESFLTPLHKTIHLTSNLGLNNTINLIWTHYEGFFFGSYNIYRGDAANNLTLLTTIASNLNSYTDLDPLAGPTFYVIEVEGISCDPTRDVVFSRSNVIAITSENVVERFTSQMVVFPNPTSRMISIKLNDNAAGKRIVLTSITGERLLERNVSNTSFQINMEEYASGIYLLQLRDKNGVVESARIVKQ